MHHQGTKGQSELSIDRRTIFNDQGHALFPSKLNMNTRKVIIIENWNLYSNLKEYTGKNRFHLAVKVFFSQWHVKGFHGIFNNFFRGKAWKPEAFFKCTRMHSKTAECVREAFADGAETFLNFAYLSKARLEKENHFFKIRRSSALEILHLVILNTSIDSFVIQTHQDQR